MSARRLALADGAIVATLAAPAAADDRSDYRASREPLFMREGSGAVTELVEVAWRDRLEPLTADEALPRL